MTPEQTKKDARRMWRKRWQNDLPTLDEQRAEFGDDLDVDDRQVRDRAVERELGRRLDR